MFKKIVYGVIIIGFIYLSFYIYKRYKQPNNLTLIANYEECIAGKFQNKYVSSVIAQLGNPDNRSHIMESEILSYGPSFDNLVNGKAKSLIAINFYVNKSGIITRCVGIYKDK